MSDSILLFIPLSLSSIFNYALTFCDRLYNYLLLWFSAFFGERLPLKHFMRSPPKLTRNHNNNSGATSTAGADEKLVTMTTKRRISTNLVKSMTLTTCDGEVHTRLKELTPSYHRHATADGITLTIDYADTFEEGSTYDKVIVAIHGTPGYYTHFDQVIQHFRHTNVRVVAPNLPNFADTRRTKTFWHTTPEKMHFIKDFLSQLNITTIDCLISHSYGIQTIAALWENPGDIKIKSVCMFAPQPLWDFDKILIEKMTGAFRYHNEIWYNFLSFVKVHKLPSMPMKFTNVNEFLMFCTIAIDQKHRDDLYKRIDLLRAMKIPVTVCYGALEKLIPKITIEKLYKQLDIKPEDIFTIDPERDDPEKLERNREIMCYSILGGRHFAHANFYQFSNQMIVDLLNHKHDDVDDDDHIPN